MSEVKYLSLTGLETVWGKIKSTFLPLTGGTLTGPLSFKASTESNFLPIRFYDLENQNRGFLSLGTNNRIALVEHAGANEYYYLPIPSTSTTSTQNYTILTTKEVPIEKDTTGAYVIWTGNITVKNSAQHPYLYFSPTFSTSNTSGEIYYDAGSATDFQRSRFAFKVSSYIAGETTPLSTSEYYYLPVADTNLEEHKYYYIVTNKDYTRDINLKGAGIYYRSWNDERTASVRLGYGSNNINHGIYSDALSNWLINGDNASVYIPKWGSIGDSTQPVYFNASGRPVACETIAVENGGTGTTDPFQVGNNIYAKSLVGGTAIPKNANLNTYVTIGNYYCSSNTIAATLSNSPVAVGFNLQVYSMIGNYTTAPTANAYRYFVQELTTLRGEKYIRGVIYSNSTTATFTDWEKTITAEDGIVSIARGGTGATTAADARSALEITPANIGALGLSGGTLTGLLTGTRAHFTSTNDASETASNSVALRLGNATGQHMDFDNNEILAKTDASTMGTLYLQGMAIESGGTVTEGVWNGTKIGITYGGTGLTASPSMLINLGSTTAANILVASPRPGVTGVLGVAHGGTGASTHALNSVLVGNAANDIKHVASANGAFYATEAGGDLKFGVLPLAQGGTGAATQANAWTNIVAPGGVITGDFRIRNNGTAPIMHFRSNVVSTSSDMGSILFQVTNGDNASIITRNYFTFRQYSYTANSATRLGKHENYSLPAATPGLVDHMYYTIYTTKNMFYGSTAPTSPVKGYIWLKPV